MTDRPDLLTRARALAAASATATDAELAAFYVAAARNALTKLVEELHQVELLVAARESEIARRGTPAQLALDEGATVMAFDQPPAGFFDEREEPLEPANDDVFREPLPPHDLVAEAAVISAEMLDPLAFDKVSALVRPEDFYSGAHLYIQEAIVGLNAESKPIDVALVGGVLRDRDRLAQVGGWPA